MPNFVPEGTIRMGRVPFDNSYRHTLTFDGAAAQQSYFASVCTQSLSRSDYTYVRMNNAIRVPFNAESLYTYNYVMYQNSNYGAKWFYSFIVGVNYVNKGVTELVLELDVMQTWYFDYTLTEGFVEREHVNDDAIGANTVPEPEMTIQYDSTYEQVFNYNKWYAVVQTSQVPDMDVDWWENITNSIVEPIQGDLYDNVWSGAAYLAFDMSSQDDRNELKAFFEIMNRAGAAEAISAVFMYPSDFIEDRLGENHRVVSGAVPFNNWYSPAMSRSSLGGYAPRNNKMFTYPYNYLMVTDGSGNRAEYRWERFEDWTPSGQQYRGVYFRAYCALSPTASVVMIPTNYHSDNYSYPDLFRTQITTPVSWTYSAYQTWLAQNSLSMAASVAATVTPFAVSSAQGISKAAGYLGMGAGAHNRLVATYGDAAVDAFSGDLAHGATEGLGGSAIGTASGLLGMVGDWYRMSKVPETLMGRSDDNTLMSAGIKQPYFYNMYPTREYCNIIDEFFDMYGYEVDRVKVPNRTGRQSWNYVKMRNSCHRGNVPAQDMAQINEIYDTGITFWHTPDVGNYSLSNEIV